MSQKRGFQMALCAQRAPTKVPKIPKASEIQTDRIENSLDNLHEILLERIGNPKIVIGVDIETHGWLEGVSKKGHIGQFGFYTMKDDASLKFARIIQIGWVTGEARIDSETLSKCYFVKPEGFEVESKATNFHGFSQEFVSKEGRKLRDVLCEFMADVKYAYQNDGIIVAHQIEFDAGVIYEELGRCGLTDLQKQWASIVRNGFCTMSPHVGRWLLKSKGSDIGPDTVQHTLGLQQVARLIIPDRAETKTHDAGYDATMSRQIFLAILEHTQKSD